MLPEPPLPPTLEEAHALVRLLWAELVAVRTEVAGLQTRVQELRQASGNPAIERTMQLLDLYCHMARWELGDVRAMNPESESG